MFSVGVRWLGGKSLHTTRCISQIFVGVVFNVQLCISTQKWWAHFFYLSWHFCSHLDPTESLYLYLHTHFLTHLRSYT